MRSALPHFFSSLFPTPRRLLRWVAALPLLLFLAIFAGGVGYVEWRGAMRFSNPAAFWLLLAAPWIWWMHAAGAGGGLSGGRAATALWIRFGLAAAMILLLAEPRAVRRSDALSVVYALDVSDSMGQKVSDQALAFVTRTAAEKPEKDEAGLIVFGRAAAVELPPRTNFPLEALHAQIGHDATNIEKGLSLAAAMLPEINPGRIVLITDGDQTEGSASGALLDQLKGRGIAVDVLPVQFDYQNEVWLERLDLPKSVKVGETYEASVILSSLKNGSGKLVLRENGKAVFEKQVEFTAGKNRLTLPLYLREPGYYEYAATIEPAPGQDGRRENNIALNDLYLRGEGKVLLVTGPQDDPRDYLALSAALRRGQRVVEERTAYEFPRDAVALLPYDCIIFDNAPADAFDPAQLQAVRDAVYNQGTGFLMVGGPNSFGPGGYHRSAVEEALPVEMDINNKKVLPKAALVIVLHTCEFPEGNTWAKRITKEAIRVLGAQDEVGLMDYEGGVGMHWVFPLRLAGEYAELAPLINQAEPGDMPSFQPAMQQGFDALKATDAAVKHLIVISDGDPSPPTPELVSQYVQQKITMSVVIINPHGGNDISLMSAVAGATGGRYYLPGDASKLPSIFIKEAKTLKRSMIQNKTFVPSVTFPSPILKGLDALPAVRGYVLTNPKDRANTILKGPEAEEIDPVLAVWRFGLGTTAAWTSDLSPNWGANWLQWEKFDAFVQQLITEISRLEQKSHLRLRAEADGGSGVIAAEDFAPEETFLNLQARVTGPGGRAETVQLRQIGPRRYQGYFPLWGKGRYQVLAAGEGEGRHEQALGGFAVAYSPEYLRFHSDPILLNQIAARTGARVLTGNESGRELFSPNRQSKESSRSVIDWFLIVAACLVPLDVAVRRVQLDWGAVFGWLRRGRKAEAGTVGSLLERKQARVAGSPPAIPRTARDVPATTAAAPPVVRQKPPTPTQPPPTPPPVAGDGPQSTTERLLARKRRRDGGNPPEA